MKEERIVSRLKMIPWAHIDQKIIPLVEATNLYAESYMSCEGHRDSTVFPYVKFLSDENLENLENAVKEYNQDSSIKWSFRRSRGSPRDDQALIYLEPEIATNQIAEKIVYEQMELLQPEDLNYPKGGPYLTELQNEVGELANFLSEKSEYSHILEQRDWQEEFAEIGDIE